MYNDDGLYRAPSLETHRSSQSGLQDLSNSSAEESAAQSGEGGIVAALEHVYRWAHYLGIWPQLGQLAEGRHYHTLRDHRLIARSSENSEVDGVHYLGDADLSGLTYAQKLDSILRQSPGSTRSKLALQDSKLFGVGLDLGHTLHGGEGTALVRGGILFSKDQARNLSHAHIAFRNARNVVALLPLDRGRMGPRMKFSDPLALDIPVPFKIAPATMALSSLPEAHDRIDRCYRFQEPYIVPGSGVTVPPWQPNLQSDSRKLNRDDAGRRAFKFFYDAVASSAYSREHEIQLEFAEYQPLNGDGELRQPNRLAEKVELKDGSLLTELPTHIKFHQLGDSEQGRRRHSPFNPFRVFNFLVLFGKNFNFACCIPAQDFRLEWWTGDEEVAIQLDQIRDFRVEIQGNADWIEELYRRIITLHSQSQRQYDLPSIASLLSNYVAATEAEVEEIFSGYAGRGKRSGVPYWKIERWNQYCAHIGYGIFLPLGRDVRVSGIPTNVVYFPLHWTPEAQIIYRATKKLPKALHAIDISPYMPVLLIQAICSRTDRRYFSPGFPTHVHAARLDRGKYPCLFYVDCDEFEMRDQQRSGYLFPSEVVDYKYLHEKYSAVAGVEMDSGRQFVTFLKQSKGYEARLSAASTDLKKCLTVPVSECVVRDGRDFVEAVSTFYADHVNDKKLMSWFEYCELYAEDEYTVQLRDLLQVGADHWLPKLFRGGADREEGDGGDEDTDDESDEEIDLDDFEDEDEVDDVEDEMDMDVDDQ